MTIGEIERFQAALGGEERHSVAAAAHLAQEFHRLLHRVETSVHWHDMTSAQNGALSDARRHELELLSHLRPSNYDPEWWTAFVRAGTSGANRLIFILEAQCAPSVPTAPTKEGSKGNGHT